MSNKSKIITTAQKYAGKGNFEKAIAEYQKVLKLDPHDIRTWLKMGDLYTRMGARGEATDTYLKVAEQYRRSGFHLKAVAVYKQILKLDPLLTDVYELLGDAYLSLGLTSEALIQFEQLADIAARQKKPHVVVETLRKILELDPNNISTRLRVAEQLSSVGQNADAVTQFNAACEQLKNQGRIDDYLKVAERLLYHDSTQLDIAREVAQIYLERNEPKRALSKLQLCFNANRKDILTLEMLAAAFGMLQQPQKAISVYTELMNIAIETNNIAQKHGYAKSILKLDPTHKVARRELGSNAAPSVAAGYMAPKTQAPSGPETMVAKLLDEAGVLVKYGLVERATEHFDKIFTIDFYNLEARERFKDVLLESGNTEGAKEQLFILVDAFIEAQPEGAVYYLHEILRIDPFSRRARKILNDIGGVIPDGLPELPDLSDESQMSGENSGLIEVEQNVNITENSEVRDSDIDLGIDIQELPYVDDANLVVDDGSQIDIIPDKEKSVVPPPPNPPMAPGLPRPSLVKGKGAPNPPFPGTASSKPLAGPSRKPPPPPKPASIAPAPPSKLVTKDIPAPAASVAAKRTGNEDQTRPVPQITGEDVSLADVPLDSLSATAPGVAVADIEEELEEIGFFIEQGLMDEARGIYDDLIALYPDDERLLEIGTQLDETRDVSEFEDLDAEIVEADADGPLNMDELSNDLNLDDVGGTQGEVAVDTVFTKFKEGVEEQISKSDYSTHFDLGQAYKEMGLWDDAIGEFKIAAEHPERAGTAELMVGMCHIGAGRFNDAIDTFDKARKLPGQSESEKLALLYEKAKVYELMEQYQDALVIYRDILNVDPGFADVVDRIGALE